MNSTHIGAGYINVLMSVFAKFSSMLDFIFYALLGIFCILVAIAVKDVKK